MLFYFIKSKRINSVFNNVINDSAMPAAIVGTSLTVGIKWIADYASPILALIGGALGIVILCLTIREKVKNLRMMDMENEEREDRHKEWHKKHDKNK
jgi:hypothetical protein